MLCACDMVFSVRECVAMNMSKRCSNSLHESLRLEIEMIGAYVGAYVGAHALLLGSKFCETCLPIVWTVVSLSWAPFHIKFPMWVAVSASWTISCT